MYYKFLIILKNADYLYIKGVCLKQYIFTDRFIANKLIYYITAGYMILYK